MSVVAGEGDGRALCCKGAPEMVLPLCTQVLQGGKVVPLDSTRRALLLATREEMAGPGLRVLLGWKPLVRDEPAAEQALIFCGLVGLEDPPRPEVPAAIACCYSTRGARRWCAGN